MSNRETFVEYYEAYFGRWYPAGRSAQEALWWRIIDKVPVVDFDKWFRKVLDNWGMRQGSPKLRSFEIAMSGLDINIYKERIPYCGICECRGGFLVPARWDEEEKKYKFDEFGGILSLTIFPCKCRFGNRYRKHMPDKEIWNEAFQIWKEVREACDCTCNNMGYEERITAEEFLIKYKGKKIKSPIAFMEAICNDSRRIDAEKNGLDVEPYKPHTLNFNKEVNLWLKKAGLKAKAEPVKDQDWMF